MYSYKRRILLSSYVIEDNKLNVKYNVPICDFSQNFSTKCVIILISLLYM